MIATRLIFVVTELRRGLVPRTHVRPNRYRAHDGFEVQVTQFAVERIERLAKFGINNEPVLLHGLELGRGRLVQGQDGFVHAKRLSEAREGCYTPPR